MWTFIVKNWKTIIVILLSIFIGILLYQNTHLNQKIKYNKHNIEVLNDSLHKWNVTKDEWVYERGLIITNSKKELEILTSFKNREIKKLEKELNNKITLINNLNINIDFLNGKIKELEGEIIKVDSLTYNLKFNYNDQWRNLEGYTQIITNHKPLNFKTILIKDIINVNLQTGLTDDYKIFVKSDCPYLNITNLDGAIINPNAFKQEEKIKRWYFGPMFGYGYYLNNNKFGIFVGIGVGYKIFSW